jgi:hypothetical protein
VKAGIAVATITGNLVVKDNRYTLLPLPVKEETKPVKQERKRGSR